jgi:protein-tyrosine phosphatase
MITTPGWPPHPDDVTAWGPGQPGVMVLPSGRTVRGRALARPLVDGPTPDFGLYLLAEPPSPVGWESRWVRWPDFRLPTHRADAEEALRDAWERTAGARVEVACRGGHGRTGTALACLAVLDGIPGHEAVRYVREHYDPRAVETPWQSRYVLRFPASGGTT